ncbi:MAG: glycosyltransferase [Gammaproteobacteria bacterium]|nr:glycosyltransferase [Gammaproteobacteria bacterium]
MLNFLFIHPAFPGQFSHLAPYLSSLGHTVVAITKHHFNTSKWKGVYLINMPIYSEFESHDNDIVESIKPRLKSADIVFNHASILKNQGYHPDVIISHPGWGDDLFIKILWPKAKFITYCEYYYHDQADELSFQANLFKPTLTSLKTNKIKNSTYLLQIAESDAAYSPTHWQAKSFPSIFNSFINVIHDGIDTSILKPNRHIKVKIQEDVILSADDQIITYVSRNLEPYRGFHVFMNALPGILKLNPKVKILIIGGDDCSYSPKRKDKKSWKEVIIDEVKNKISHAHWQRIFFLGVLPYEQYLTILQISTVHVYLTFPFVLSWSLLEAMSVGCAIITNNTAPVMEVVEDNNSAILIDFLDYQGLAVKVTDLLHSPELRSKLGNNAREHIITHYDLKTICLPKQIALIEKTIALQIKPVNTIHQKNHNITANVLFACATFYHRNDNLDSALELYNQLLNNNPTHLDAIGNRALVLLKLNQLDKAEKDFLYLLSHNKNDEFTLRNLGKVKRYNGQFDESIAYFKQAIEVSNSARSHWDLATTFLHIGNFKEAWEHFDYRNQLTGISPPLKSKPIWKTENLAQKHLLILDEQGIGDTIQFLRFIPLLEKNYHCKIYFLGKPSVCPLVQLLIPKVTIVDKSFQHYNYWLPLMSLPSRLGINSPKQIPLYPSFKLEPSNIKRWKKLINKSEHRPAIAIFWQGNKQFKGDKYRSPGLKPLLPILQMSHVQFLSIQVGEGRRDIYQYQIEYKLADIGLLIEQSGSQILDTLAVIKNCDLIISPCTSVAHMAGLMGKPMLLLLSNQADWRWMQNRDDSPWYPSISLLRNQSHHWDDISQSIIAYINNWLKHHSFL